MAYNIDNIIVNLKREIQENAGGSSGPTITNTTLKSVCLLHQESVNETLSYTVTEPAYLVIALNAMTASSITLTVNDYSYVQESGFYKFASAMIPVYENDEIVLECVSEGSDENLICNIMLINGFEVPEPPTPPTNNNEKKGD